MKYTASVLGAVWSLLNPVVFLAVFSFLVARPRQPDPRLPGLPAVGAARVELLLERAAGRVAVRDRQRESREEDGVPARDPSTCVRGRGAVRLRAPVGRSLALHRCSPATGSIFRSCWLYPLAIAASIVFTTAITLWVSALNVRYRDVGHLLSLALLVWFWFTPIVYQGWLVQQKLEEVQILGLDAWALYLLNPVAVIVIGFQRALYAVVPAPGEDPILPVMSFSGSQACCSRCSASRFCSCCCRGARSSTAPVTSRRSCDDRHPDRRASRRCSGSIRERPTSLKQRLLVSRSRSEEFWALRDVSFDIADGSSLGLIGHNGSGKTTLLKCIAGILRPTAGTIRYRGRLAALLELGAGFHPDLTGRENVYLNASFLGLSRRETDRIFDDIVAFAELEDFMDNQVKFYSSGMLVRLGFAVAVHVDPEVLLIDEVLAVGDESFQRRCLDRVRRFQSEGRTIVLVTHALDVVREVCDEAVMLDHGRVHAIGTPDDVVRTLRHRLAQRRPALRSRRGEPGGGDLRAS